MIAQGRSLNLKTACALLWNSPIISFLLFYPTDGRESQEAADRVQDTAPLCQSSSWGHVFHYCFSWKCANANSRSGEGHGFSCSLGVHTAQRCAVPGHISGGKVEPWPTCLWRNPTHFFLRKDRLCKEESSFQQRCVSCSGRGEEGEEEATRDLRCLFSSTFEPVVSICLLLIDVTW